MKEKSNEPIIQLLQERLAKLINFAYYLKFYAEKFLGSANEISVNLKNDIIPIESMQLFALLLQNLSTPW